MARATKRLGDRVDDHIRSERRRLTAELDVRVEELAATTDASASTFEEDGSRGEAIAPASGEVAASEWAPDPATRTVDSSGLEDEEQFGKIFESMRHSLGLKEKRWAEAEVESEQVLASLWPEYVALSKSGNPDTADLDRRYYARIEAILAAEEAARLGCGGGKMMNVVQPPPPGTTP